MASKRRASDTDQATTSDGLSWTGKLPLKDFVFGVVVIDGAYII
jgi:hypothetical protein